MPKISKAGTCSKCGRSAYRLGAKSIKCRNCTNLWFQSNSFNSSKTSSSKE